MPQLQRLLQHEAGLRHGALEGVDQQQHAVDHFENALHLAAKVGVSRGVDDVDLDALVEDRRVFGQNRDAALALKVVGIHDALCHHLVFAEYAALLEHLVDQCGFAVVNVGNDGDIAQFFSFGHR